MPEGDTILWAATRMRPVLEAQAVEVVQSHPRFALDRLPRRLDGHTVTAVETHGKNLFLVFDHGLLLHSHLRMTGAWDVRSPGGRWMRSPRRAWLVLRAGSHEVIQFDGPVLELMTVGRRRFDQRLAGLGPDVLAAAFDGARYLTRLRAANQTQAVGDALLDQRLVAGIGNIWKSEGCWEAGIDPWRPLATISNAEAAELIDAVRPRMLESGNHGPRSIRPRVYRRTGEPCPRCGATIRARGQGDQNRTTYWCPGCQR